MREVWEVSDMDGLRQTEEQLATVLRRFHSIYGTLMSRLVEDPTIDAALDVLQSLAPGPVAVTDAEGVVTHASFDFTPGHRIEPPDPTVTLDVPMRIGSFWCATPVSAPRSLFLWMLGHDSADPLDVMTLMDIATERIHILSAYTTARVDQRREASQRLVTQLVLGHPGADRRSLATELGHDLEKPHHVFIIDPPPNFSPSGFESLVDEAVGGRALTALADGSVIVISNDIDGLHALVRRIEGLDAHGAIRVGVSRATTDGSDLRRAHAQALFAASVLPAGTHSAISWFDDCDLLQLLSRHADDETIDRSIADILAPLLEYEGPHREEFIETLRLWLDSTDSLDVLAERLHIHRSTLTYRLRRLRELLGEDLRDPDRRFKMSLALRLRERRARVS